MTNTYAKIKDITGNIKRYTVPRIVAIGVAIGVDIGLTALLLSSATTIFHYTIAEDVRSLRQNAGKVQRPVYSNQLATEPADIAHTIASLKLDLLQVEKQLPFDPRTQVSEIDHDSLEGMVKKLMPHIASELKLDRVNRPSLGLNENTERSSYSLARRGWNRITIRNAPLTSAYMILAHELVHAQAVDYKFIFNFIANLVGVDGKFKNPINETFAQVVALETLANLASEGDILARHQFLNSAISFLDAELEAQLGSLNTSKRYKNYTQKPAEVIKDVLAGRYREYSGVQLDGILYAIEKAVFENRGKLSFAYPSDLERYCLLPESLVVCTGPIEPEQIKVDGGVSVFGYSWQINDFYTARYSNPRIFEMFGVRKLPLVIYNKNPYQSVRMTIEDNGNLIKANLPRTEKGQFYYVLKNGQVTDAGGIFSESIGGHLEPELFNEINGLFVPNYSEFTHGYYGNEFIPLSVPTRIVHENHWKGLIKAYSQAPSSICESLSKSG